MTNLSMLSDTLKIIGVSADLLSNKFVKGSAKAALGIKSASSVGGSITQLSGQSQIISRVFAEDAAVEEAVYPNLIKHCFDWYTAQILAALNISKLITSKVNVQQMLSIVQDGRYDRASSFADNILREVAGVESFVCNYKGEMGLEAFREKYQHGPQLMSVADASKLAAENDELKGQVADLKAPFKDSHVDLKSVKVSENRMGPMGELFEITMTNPNNKEVSVTVPVFVQIQPTIIPTHVAPRFIDLNVLPEIWRRWTQWRAGEISFFRDFVAKKDLMDRKLAVVKDPEAAHAMTQFLSTITKKDKYAIGDLNPRTNTAKSANLANSILIVTEDTVLRAKADSSVDLHDTQTRARYFRDTYTMIIAVVDMLHQRVTVYFNGIDGSLNCSYNEFKPVGAKMDSADFINALTAFSTNSIGRLR